MFVFGHSFKTKTVVDFTSKVVAMMCLDMALYLQALLT